MLIFAAILLVEVVFFRKTEDAAAFVAFIDTVPGETLVAWYSHKDEQAHPGAWVRRGMCRLKHGSFVDPTDLFCYAAQYYEPFASGRHECVQIGRSPKTMAAPDDVTPASTVADLAAAIRALAEVAKEAAADAAPAAGDAEAAAKADAAAAASATLVLKLLQPDYAFEFHGALTRGWHAQLYAAESEDGTLSQLIVLR
ncbi:hypothetical protein VJ918_06405 [Adlercreutzia sp. R21]|uniref:hypothetical protein n=1 Tax=Adlercreutzia wanghongyangiae TaxID=3111451 RepID=UPI002DB7ECF0|nr:hypothetical protein [Adlercreutzia sp. R21]MEC4184442.1 hypothetical protein [Adlercreutzia sp. R21]